MKRLYDPKTSPLRWRLVEWLGWRVHRIINILFNFKKWHQGLTPWERERFTSNNYATLLVLISGVLLKSAISEEFEIQWLDLMSITLLYWDIQNLRDANEWKLKKAEKRDIDAELKKEKEKEEWLIS